MIEDILVNFNWVDILIAIVIIRMIYTGSKSNILVEFLALLGIVIANFVTVHYYVYFADFLKTAELFDPWVEECPLDYMSPNAPKVRDILGTAILSILAGQKRYSHITSLRNDGVAPGMLGMSKICSEDSVRRAFENADAERTSIWMYRHMRRVWESLLSEIWILDIDTTVKPLYGHKQEGAVVGYNPTKPGRPSHAYHTYFMAKTRVLLDVEVEAGNHTASKYSAPCLFALLDGLPSEKRPWLIRGDCGLGNEGMMARSEERGQSYLFKLRMTSGVNGLIKRLFAQPQWLAAGEGWSRQRRVVVLRRRIKENMAAQKSEDGQLLFFESPGDSTKVYEYAVLISNLAIAVESMAQLYRDRADCENCFDELKNQWGWTGYTTKDLKRCQIMARMVALVYNWWTMFAGLAISDRHAEAVTSRPLLLYAVGRQSRHGGQTTITLTSAHGDGETVRKIMEKIAAFFSRIRAIAEQLSWEERWRMILSAVFVRFMRGRIVGTPILTPVLQA